MVISFLTLPACDGQTFNTPRRWSRTSVALAERDNQQQ